MGLYFLGHDVTVFFMRRKKNKKEIWRSDACQRQKGNGEAAHVQFRKNSGTESKTCDACPESR